jgi:homospermidine synthase
VKKGVMYLNTAMEEWEDSENPISFPKDYEDLYKTTLLYRHDIVRDFKIWDSEKGATTIFEHGMNPGLISHFAKTGILDAARYFLKNQQKEEFKDLDFKAIENWLNLKNYSKLAQALGLHTIHCSEKDDQVMKHPPNDTKIKFYNTWSCRGFLTEGMVPIQAARGSHEDETHEDFPRVKNEKLIMSWAPSNHFWGILRKIFLIKIKYFIS